MDGTDALITLVIMFAILEGSRGMRRWWRKKQIAKLLREVRRPDDWLAEGGVGRRW